MPAPGASGLHFGPHETADPAHPRKREPGEFGDPVVVAPGLRHIWRGTVSWTTADRDWRKALRALEALVSRAKANPSGISAGDFRRQARHRMGVLWNVYRDLASSKPAGGIAGRDNEQIPRMLREESARIEHVAQGLEAKAKAAAGNGGEEQFGLWDFLGGGKSQQRVELEEALRSVGYGGKIQGTSEIDAAARMRAVAQVIATANGISPGDKARRLGVLWMALRAANQSPEPVLTLWRRARDEIARLRAEESSRQEARKAEAAARPTPTERGVIDVGKAALGGLLRGIGGGGSR